ncbi:MAG: GNAT family N-acetyltransferase, partial [Promethearchaeota archaeon]
MKKYRQIDESEISNQFLISESTSENEMKIVQKGLKDHNKKYPGGELDIPTPDVSLVLKDDKGNVVGGVITSMLTGIMHLEVLWVDEKYRDRGYGRDLVLQAERIGKEKGYPASQTWTFSFQAPEFYQRIGYKIVGIFEGYTDGIIEYILLKKFRSIEGLENKDIEPNRNGFTISEDKSKESMEILHEGLRKYVRKHVGELRKNYPGIGIKLIGKNAEGQVIGGLQAYTTLKAVHIESLWIDGKYRNQGYGRELLMTAERIAT